MVIVVPMPTSETISNSSISRLAPGKPVAESAHAPQRLVNSDGEEQPLDTVRGRNVAAVSGIGNPAAFTRTLTDLGAVVVDHAIYPDHHAYTQLHPESGRVRDIDAVTGG